MKSDHCKNLAKYALKYYYDTILGRKYNFKKIHTPTITCQEQHILNFTDIQKLLKHAISKKNKLIISFLYSSNVRIGAFTRISREDVDWDTKLIKIRKGKGRRGGKERKVKISETLCKEL